MPHDHCFSQAQVFKAISQSTTNTTLNLCNSSHAIQSETHKLNLKDFSWLVMRLGCKQNVVFLGCKNLKFQESIRPQINPFSLLFQLLLLVFQYLQHLAQLLFLEFLFLFYFYFSSFYLLLIDFAVCVVIFLPQLLPPNKLPQICL